MTPGRAYSSHHVTGIVEKRQKSRRGGKQTVLKLPFSLSFYFSAEKTLGEGKKNKSKRKVKEILASAL